MKTLAAVALAAILIRAVPAGAQETPYVLKSGSSYATGCYGPCLCPVQLQAMTGSFRLSFSGVDPLFSHYDVRDVQWSVPGASPSLTITGSGTYRVGGEFAAQHQMVLDLSVSGAPPQRFDSGLVLGGGTFPQIDISVSLHQNQACRDTVLHVVASPSSATSAEGTPGLTTGIRSAGANPFRGGAQFFVSMATPSRVEVGIFDLQGRLVKRLASERRMVAGVHPVEWDGRDHEGQACAGGLYFARATIGGKRYVAKVIRIP